MALSGSITAQPGCSPRAPSAVDAAAARDAARDDDAGPDATDATVGDGDASAVDAARDAPDVAAPDASAPRTPPAAAGYTLAFSDDFDALDLSTNSLGLHT